MNKSAPLLEFSMLAREKQLGFSLTYEEVSGTWYFQINSCAPEENFISKNSVLWKIS